MKVEPTFEPGLRSSSTPARRVTCIEVFADVSCPFAYVGLRRLFEAREAHGSDARVHVRAWPLEWINGRQLEPDLVAAEIAALRAGVAPHLFAGFDPARFPDSTIDALGLAAAAYKVDVRVGEQVSLLLREAIFEKGQDVTDRALLHSIGRVFGVELLSRAVAEPLVRADWERGRARNVRGSPQFFVGTRSWFCPSLRIRHEGSDFDISVDSAALDDFYSAAFG
jgi:predicted DsbA family dithiol-disulfide isomerase